MRVSNLWPSRIMKIAGQRPGDPVHPVCLRGRPPFVPWSGPRTLWQGEGAAGFRGPLSGHPNLRAEHAGYGGGDVHIRIETRSVQVEAHALVLSERPPR